MRTIIAGSRECTDYNILLEVIAVVSTSWDISAVLSGTARGPDRLGERWAGENNIPLEQFPADWDLHGNSAGYIRNSVMAKNAEALIALWDGSSKGTGHIIDLARKSGLEVYVHRVNPK